MSYGSLLIASQPAVSLEQQREAAASDELHFKQWREIAANKR
jgi:hypothetical protein